MKNKSDVYVGPRQWEALRRLCDPVDGLYVEARDVARAAYGVRWRTAGMQTVRALLAAGLAERQGLPTFKGRLREWPLVPDDLVRVTPAGEAMRLRPADRDKAVALATPVHADSLRDCHCLSRARQTA